MLLGIKKMRIIYIVLLLGCNIFYSCISNKNNVLLELIKEDSFFNDFEVIGDKVFIKCIITVKNNTENNIQYKINAIFEDDVRIGLLKNEKLEGYAEDLMSNVFIISASETIKYQTVIFVGEFAGNYRKYNRELPKNINIVLLE
jgi:hypothetical protein